MPKETSRSDSTEAVPVISEMMKLPALDMFTLLKQRCRGVSKDFRISLESFELRLWYEVSVGKDL